MIEVANIVKQFPAREQTDQPTFRTMLSRRKRNLFAAVDDISFSIREGELVAYIGPNGAGKSTTIKMLTGILNPTAGCIAVNGIDPFKNRMENTRRIGVVFGQRSQLWWHLPIEDSYKVFAEMYRVPKETYRKRIEMLKELLELDEFWNQPVRSLSLGQRMRGELAAALIHNPDILYLDEPTIGMDVIVKERIRDFLAEINRRDGVTIVLTTHDLDDVERLCGRVMVINHGKLIYDGTMNALRERCDSDARVTVVFEGGVPPLPDSLRNVKIDGTRLSFSFNRSNDEGEMLGRIVSAGSVRDIKIDEAPVEDVVRDLYEG